MYFEDFPAVPASPPAPSDFSDSSEDEEEIETEIVPLEVPRSNKVKAKKFYLRWSMADENDLDDIICNNKFYRDNIIFQNSMNKSNKRWYLEILNKISNWKHD